MNRILKEDIESFSLPGELCAQLRDSIMIITGSTGLIGSIMVRVLAHLNLGIRFILPVRDERKAHRLFSDLHYELTIVEKELTQFFRDIVIKADFIIHCASPTDGAYMTARPAETFLLAIDSTRAILDYARKTNPKAILYLSSIEYYGTIHNDDPVGEDAMGKIAGKSARSSYPLGKQAAEYLSFCYATEYGVPVMTARLTQTFGAGISRKDSRVFAQFARSALKGENIVLHTPGNSAKPYCYTIDVAAALIYILLRGKPGEAYNVSTPGTYVSIRQLAELFRDEINPEIDVIIDIKQGSYHGYAPETTVNLDSSRLLALGWKPRFTLPEMIRRLADYLKEPEQS